MILDGIALQSGGAILAALAKPPPAPLVFVAALAVDLMIPRASARPGARALAPLDALRRRLDRSGRGEGALKVRGAVVALSFMAAAGGLFWVLERLLALAPFGWLGIVAILAALMGARAPLDAARRAISGIAAGRGGGAPESLARIALDRLGARFVDGPAAIFAWYLVLGLGGAGLALAARLAGALAAEAPESPFSRGLVAVHRWVMAPVGWIAPLALGPAAVAVPGGRPFAAFAGPAGRPAGAAAGSRTLAAGIGRVTGGITPVDLGRAALAYILGCIVLVALAALVLGALVARA